MISDLDLVKACADTYGLPPTLPVPVTGTDVRITQAADGAWIAAFRGSVTLEDWLRDFFFAPVVAREHPQLGRCHAGFLDGAESVVAAISAVVIDDPYYLAGHSLGGALALGVGGLTAAIGRPPRRVATFGAPRFGMTQFVEFMANIPIGQYRRGNDIVPEVPRDVPPDLAFLDTRAPLISVGVAQVDFLKCHAIAGYVADVDAYLKAKSASIAA
jgi:predicted lipase